MEPTAVTLIDVKLEDPAQEEAFLAWWAQAEELLAIRARLARARVAVLARGVYHLDLEFRLPGGYKLVTADRPWLELVERRPACSFESREARFYRRSGPGAYVTTGELARWLEERRRGDRDFVLVDALKPEAFAEAHLPGAVNLPADGFVDDEAIQLLGDRGRHVVIYCGGYG